VDDEGKPGVLKVLTNNSSKLVELFEREAEILRQLRHLGIPRFDTLFTFVPSNGTELRCLVMEEIEGQNLKQWLENNGAISEDIALNWLSQLVEILDLVHRNRFLHQDIKPDNIMHTADDRLVLIDFSYVSGIVSLGYTPPEQAEGKAVPQSDFFALGRTFVHLMTGRHPIDLPKDPETCRLIWRPSAPQVSQLLADLIDDLMAPFPGQRPQNAQVILQKLGEIQQSLFLRLPSQPFKLDSQELRTQHSQTVPRRGRSRNEDLPFPLPSPSSLKLQPLLSIFKLGNSEQIKAPGNHRVEPQTSRRKMPFKKLLVGGTTLVVGASVISWYLTGVNGCSKIWLRSFPVGDHLSCGEEILTPDSAVPEKQEGIKAYAAGNYNEAVDWLKKARNKHPDDPEVLIYLNNAQIEVQKVKAYTIAVAVPISSNPDKAFEILRGVAQAQNEVNQGKKIPDRRLKVLIADDANNPDQAKQIAHALTTQSNILAVVGHYTSEITLDTMDIYEQRKLVLISPGSTSVNLQGAHDKFFFRTVPTTLVNAQKLADYLLRKGNVKKAAVFYNPRSYFSKSFYEQFDARFSGGETEIVKVEAFDLSNSLFNPGAAIDEAKKKGATAIVMIPDGGTSRYSLENTIKLIKANQGDLWMVGANTVYSTESLLVGQDAVDRLVVAVPWIAMKSPNPDFPKDAQSLWGRGEISSRTSAAYDAAQALIEALEKTPHPNPNRLEVQKVLSDPDFTAKGATGLISFMDSGDRKEVLVELAKVVPSKCSDYGYIFVPENYSPAQVKSLERCR
jgi:ABC-type branched-subunit amino acid transport system substrate-binding protein/serine/threonine protein kinase